VRVLLDEQVPVGLAPLLQGHDIQTVSGMGWTGITNGELLQRAAGRFDAFLTMDRKLPAEHNLSAVTFGIVLVRAPSNRLRNIAPLAPQIHAVLSAVRPGQLLQVGG
jgi:hypothetical protein